VTATNELVREIVRLALREDIGTGDVTSETVVESVSRARAVIVSKADGVLAGLPLVLEVFHQISPDVTVSDRLEEGARIGSGDILCRIEGPARAILGGERVALNFLQRMSGIATLTSRFVDAIAGTSARIVDTRKTTPGLRILEKQAVLAGGGHNHRMGLYDAVMVKDNHIAAAGGIREAVRKARAMIPHTMTITVECENLVQVDEALNANADILLLDNMDGEARREAVRRAKGKALTEASGGITLETVAEVARTGVDLISVGALTHSAPALDISLDIVEVV